MLALKSFSEIPNFKFAESLSIFEDLAMIPLSSKNKETMQRVLNPLKQNLEKFKGLKR
jgi:hypothetical protein